MAEIVAAHVVTPVAGVAIARGIEREVIERFVAQEVFHARLRPVGVGRGEGREVGEIQQVGERIAVGGRQHAVDPRGVTPIGDPIRIGPVGGHRICGRAARVGRLAPARAVHSWHVHAGPLHAGLRPVGGRGRHRRQVGKIGEVGEQDGGVVGKPGGIAGGEAVERGGERVVGRAGLRFGSVDDEAADGFERGSLVAGVAVELAHEFVGIVGDERDRVAHTGDEHVEQALVGEVGLVGEHHPDPFVGGDPLRHVHVERVGERQAREHRVAGFEGDRILRGEFDGDAAVLDPGDGRERGIVHSPFRVVGGPADRLALVEADGVEGGDLEPFEGDGRIELLRREADLLRAAPHLHLVGEDAGDLVGAAPAQPQFGDMAGDGDLLADLVELGVTQFLGRQADTVVDGDIEARAA